MSKKILFWILAVIISLGTMVYQRLTGPTYEKNYLVTVEGVPGSSGLIQEKQVPGIPIPLLPDPGRGRGSDLRTVRRDPIYPVHP